MKSRFKLLSPFCLAAIIALSLHSTGHARDVILVESLAGPDQARLVGKILKEKFHLPEKLMRIRTRSLACEENSDALIHFCVLKDGDLKVIKMNEYVVKNSLDIYLNAQSAKEGTND